METEELTERQSQFFDEMDNFFKFLSETGTGGEPEDQNAFINIMIRASAFYEKYYKKWNNEQLMFQFFKTEYTKKDFKTVTYLLNSYKKIKALKLKKGELQAKQARLKTNDGKGE